MALACSEDTAREMCARERDSNTDPLPIPQIEELPGLMVSDLHIEGAEVHLGGHLLENRVELRACAIRGKRQGIAQGSERRANA